MKISCPHCDSSWSVSDELEGKRIRCRKCDKPFVIAAPEPPEEEEEQEEETPRPARRDKRRSPKRRSAKAGIAVWVWIGIGGAFLLLVLIGGAATAAILLWRPSAASPPGGPTASTPGGGAPAAGSDVSAPGGGAPVGGGSVTLANIQKLRKGMSEAEVTALLGPPTEFVKPTPVGDAQADRKMLWRSARDPSLFLAVLLQNGAVLGAYGKVDGRDVFLSLETPPGMAPTIR